MNSSVAPLLEQATVVPSGPQARNLSRNSQFQSFTSTRNVSLSLRRHFTTLFNRTTDVRIVQKHDNIARGVISMESLCLRLGKLTVTRARHAQPDRCQRWMTRPQREGLMVLILMWALAPQHCCRPGFPQTELSSMHAPWEHHPLDWLRRENGLSPLLSS